MISRMTPEGPRGVNQWSLQAERPTERKSNSEGLNVATWTDDESGETGRDQTVKGLRNRYITLYFILRQLVAIDQCQSGSDISRFQL